MEGLHKKGVGARALVVAPSMLPIYASCSSKSAVPVANLRPLNTVLRFTSALLGYFVSVIHSPDNSAIASGMRVAILQNDVS